MTYGSPRDPALQKEYQDYLKQKLGDAAPAAGGGPARKKQ
jgi:hypothetical protein